MDRYADEHGGPFERRRLPGRRGGTRSCGRFYPGDPIARGGRDYDADFRTARPGRRRRRYLLRGSPPEGWSPERHGAGLPARGTRSYDIDYGPSGGGSSEYSGGSGEVWHRGPYPTENSTEPERYRSGRYPGRGRARKARHRWVRDPYGSRGGGGRGS